MEIRTGDSSRLISSPGGLRRANTLCYCPGLCQDIYHTTHTRDSTATINNAYGHRPRRFDRSVGIHLGVWMPFAPPLAHRLKQMYLLGKYV